MIFKRIKQKYFYEGVIRKLVNVIPKEGNLGILIIEGQLFYLQLLIKLSQIRLQPMLRNMISLEQTTFLPLRFIVDDIF